MSSRVAVVVPVAGSRERGPAACLADLGGRPLLSYTLEAAREAPGVARVLVATDDRDVAACAQRWGAELLAPVPGSCSAMPAEEALLARAALDHEGEAPELVALMDPWMPLRRPNRLADACETLRRDAADSLMTVCPCSPHLWRASPGGLIPFYDPTRRSARAETSAPWLRESGSLYLCRDAGLARHRQRLFGRITTLETDWTESLRADEAAGLDACRALLGHVRAAWRPMAARESAR